MGNVSIKTAIFHHFSSLSPPKSWFSGINHCVHPIRRRSYAELRFSWDIGLNTSVYRPEMAKWLSLLILGTIGPRMVLTGK